MGGNGEAQSQFAHAQPRGVLHLSISFGSLPNAVHSGKVQGGVLEEEVPCGFHGDSLLCMLLSVAAARGRRDGWHHERGGRGSGRGLKEQRQVCKRGLRGPLHNPAGVGEKENDIRLSHPCTRARRSTSLTPLPPLRTHTAHMHVLSLTHTHTHSTHSTHSGVRTYSCTAPNVRPTIAIKPATTSPRGTRGPSWASANASTASAT